MRTRRRAFIVLSLLVLGLSGLLPASAASGTNPALAPGASAAAGGCPGTAVPVNFTAQVVVVGAPSSPPPVSNVSVAVAYDYQMSHVPNGGSTTVSCQPGSVNNATDSYGHVQLVAAIPSSSCDRVSCNYYSGPFGPTAFSLPAGPPPGYFLAVGSHGGSTVLDLVAALSQVSLTPRDQATVSAFAPTQVHANATAGDGRASPANISYKWSIDGRGWSITGGKGTSTVTVVAEGGGLATLALATNGTFGSGYFALPVQVLQLVAVATQVTSASLSPTSLDSGTPATFTLQGVGSAGYSYVASIRPGLGLAPVSAPCRSSAAPGGTVTLDCVALVTYPSPGNAQPSANLTNGYSTANDYLAQIAVAPPLAVSLGPDPALSYVGSSIDLTVQVPAQSGTGPFSPACLWSGVGSLECRAGPGPTWSFPVTYGASGNYVVRATVSDAAGSNRTTSLVAQVFDRPTLDPIVASTHIVSLGGAVELGSSFRGGALSANYWWNDSSPNGTFASGVVGQDGLIRTNLILSSPGSHALSLTIRDALGTVVARSTVVDVLSPPTRIVDSAGPPPLGVAAGAPWTFSWMAVDPLGGRIPNYSTNVSLSLPNGSPSRAPVWVNTSGLSFVLWPGSTAVLPGGAWRLGLLNFSVTAVIAGPLSLAAHATLPIDASPSGALSVSVFADFDHPMLRHPTVVHAGLRSNATRWSISDRWGNPLTSGFVVVRTVFSSVVTNSDSPIEWNGTESLVWVNYSAPSGVSGTVYVLSEWGDAVLLSVGVPGPTTGPDTASLLLLAGAAGALVSALALTRWRSRRRTGSDNVGDGEVGEEELRRVAEGRAHILRRATGAGALSLDQLGEGFDGPPPLRAELTEWVAGLVSEGAISASPGPNGVLRFVAVERPEPLAPRVVVDPELLEAALSRQEEAETFSHDGP